MSHKSLLISTAIQEREVELSNGEKIKLHFKELPRHEIFTYVNEFNSSDLEVKRLADERFIAKSLCNADGTAYATVEEISQYKWTALNAIGDVVRDINGMGEKKA